MKELDIQALKAKANRSFEAAKRLLKDGDYDFAVSRCYYTLFYIAEAMLLMKGKSFSKHSALLSYFFHEYVENGVLPIECHQILNDAFELRMDADYLIPNVITQEKSENLIERCEFFLRTTGKFFKD